MAQQTNIALDIMQIRALLDVLGRIATSLEGIVERIDAVEARNAEEE